MYIYMCEDGIGGTYISHKPGVLFRLKSSTCSPSYAIDNQSIDCAMQLAGESHVYPGGMVGRYSNIYIYIHANYTLYDIATNV